MPPHPPHTHAPHTRTPHTPYFPTAPAYHPPTAHPPAPGLFLTRARRRVRVQALRRTLGAQPGAPPRGVERAGEPDLLRLDAGGDAHLPPPQRPAVARDPAPWARLTRALMVVCSLRAAVIRLAYGPRAVRVVSGGCGPRYSAFERERERECGACRVRVRVRACEARVHSLWGWRRGVCVWEGWGLWALVYLYTAFMCLAFRLLAFSNTTLVGPLARSESRWPAPVGVMDMMS